MQLPPESIRARRAAALVATVKTDKRRTVSHSPDRSSAGRAASRRADIVFEGRRPGHSSAVSWHSWPVLAGEINEETKGRTKIASAMVGHCAAELTGSRNALIEHTMQSLGRWNALTEHTVQSLQTEMRSTRATAGQWAHLGSAGWACTRPGPGQRETSKDIHAQQCNETMRAWYRHLIKEDGRACTDQGAHVQMKKVHARAKQCACPRECMERPRNAFAALSG